MEFLDFVNGSQACAINCVPACKVQRLLDAVPSHRSARDQVDAILDLCNRRPTKLFNLRFRDGMFAGWKQLTLYEVDDLHGNQRTITFEEIDFEYNLENEDDDLSCVFELC